MNGTTRPGSAAERARLDVEGRAAFAGFALAEVARTTSTQEVVRTMARGGAAEGACCVAAEQTAGRGRQGRSWTAPPGTALLFSVLLRRPAAVAAGIPLAAGLAISDAVTEVAGLATQLKWPNDVLVDGAKLAGVLAEADPPGAGAAIPIMLGCGINISVPDFPPGVAGVSLHSLTDPPPSWRRLLGVVLRTLARRLDDVNVGGIPALLDDWRARATGLGSPVVATTPGGPVRGIVVDIDSDGALLVRTKGGMVRLIAGDVHIGL